MQTTYSMERRLSDVHWIGLRVFSDICEGACPGTCTQPMACDITFYQKTSLWAIHNLVLVIFLRMALVQLLLTLELLES